MEYIVSIIVSIFAALFGWQTIDVSSPGVIGGTETFQETPPSADDIQPNLITQPISAAVLDMSSKGLKDVPISIFSKTNLEQLNLSDNQLTGALQAEIRQLQQLRILDLSNNNFTGVPAEIGQLSNLEVLNISDNQLTGLPHELGNLQNLMILDLRGNDISSFDLDIIRERLGPDITIKI